MTGPGRPLNTEELAELDRMAELDRRTARPPDGLREALIVALDDVPVPTARSYVGGGGSSTAMAEAILAHPRFRAALATPPAPDAGLREAVEDVLVTLERVVTDSESQHPGGWGPDVTTVADLRDCQSVLSRALATPTPAPAIDARPGPSWTEDAEGYVVAPLVNRGTLDAD